MITFNTTVPKIVVTLGPSTRDSDIISALIEQGMNVARFNFSHGDHVTHKEHLHKVREAALSANASMITFADLCGPKVRIGKLENGSCTLHDGDTFVLTGEECIGTVARASVTYHQFSNGIEAGMVVYLDDGKIELVIERVEGDSVVTRVVRGGLLEEEKGVNVPEAKWKISSLTEKDRDDMRFIMQEGYDAIALSFVRKKEDIEEAQALMREISGRVIPIIAKIETKQAIHAIEEIIQVADCVMVARGDLGVEIGLEHVPKSQKQICAVAKTYKKPVIVATQVLQSMIDHQIPTRAEASDVVNAILDGASYIMLSDETTIGAYPVEAVRELHNIMTMYNEKV